MSEGESEYFAVCTECVSFLSCDSKDEAAEKAESHNTRSHDEQERARVVNVRDAADLRPALEAMERHSPGDEYANLVRRMYRGNAPFFCPSALYEEAVPQAHQRQYGG